MFCKTFWCSSFSQLLLLLLLLLWLTRFDSGSNSTKWLDILHNNIDSIFGAAVSPLFFFSQNPFASSPGFNTLHFCFKGEILGSLPWKFVIVSFRMRRKKKRTYACRRHTFNFTLSLPLNNKKNHPKIFSCRYLEYAWKNNIIVHQRTAEIIKEKAWGENMID